MLKAALLAHLKHEDTDLYPALRIEAKTNPQIQSNLNVLATNMDEVAGAALEFFGKYEKGGDQNSFVKDFARVAVLLGTRIRREEESLHPLFDKMTQKVAA